MKFNFDENILNEYIERSNLCILFTNIVGEFLLDYRKTVSKKKLNKYIEEEKCSLSSAYYKYLLEALDLDPNDEMSIDLFEEFNLDKNIQVLDENSYENDPYRKLNLKEFSKGLFKLQYNEYSPLELVVYDEAIANSTNNFLEKHSHGFFRKPFKFYELTKNDETWMSTTPFEINSMKQDVKDMKGKIAVCGLGLGYIAYLLSLKNDVTEIDIIDNDKELISFIKGSIFNQINKNKKINIINTNCFSYLEANANKYDFIYLDTYHDVNDGIEHFMNMKKIELDNRQVQFRYWLNKSFIQMLRRSIFTSIYEDFLKVEYQASSSMYDLFIEFIKNNFKDFIINNENELKNFISDDNINKLIFEFISSSYFSK